MSVSIMSQVIPIPVPPTGPPPSVQYYVYLYENGTWSVGESPIAPPLGTTSTDGMFPPPPPPQPCNKERMKEALINILSDNNLFSNNFNKGNSPFWK